MDHMGGCKIENNFLLDLKLFNQKDFQISPTEEIYFLGGGVDKKKARISKRAFFYMAPSNKAI